VKASPIVLALNVTALACGALLLVAVFRDPAPVDVGLFTLEIGSFGPAVAASGALAILYALVYRGALRAWFGRLATGELDGRDARAGRIALGALIVTGFVLRIARIQEYGFNPDEAQFIYFGAADSLATVWSMVVNGSPHPPANFAMLHFLLKVSWNPLWLRLPSVLSGTFLIWVAHRFGRSLFGPAAGIAMAVLVTFSPGTLELSRVCRNYAPGFVFLLLSIHLMVRHLRTDHWRPLGAFAVIAPVAAIWHYVFVIAFLALDLVVAVELLLRRRPWRAWLAVALAHLPLAATMGFFYFAHISQISSTMVEFHQTVYESMLLTSAVEFTRPFQEAWHYLEISPFDEIFFGFSVLGAFCLLVNRERLGLLVCVTPLALAYAFSWAGLIPLGGTRHSAYLFPFLFGLVASQIPELLDGYRRTAANLRRHLGRVTPGRVVSPPGGEATRPARRRLLAAPALGTALVAISGAAFAGASLLDYGVEGVFNPYIPRFAGRELPTWYRLEDVERGFALIEERVGENDLVVLPSQGALAARMHYHLTPGERKRKRLRETTQPVHKDTVNGVTYYDAHGPMIVSFTTLLEAVERVLSFYRLPEPERVWMVQGSWEFSLNRQFRRRFPELPFDADVARASNDLVFSVGMKSLRAVVAEERAIKFEKKKKRREARRKRGGA
jgi:hypothetical protein